jgi:hypothetical protein cdiviTM7_00597
MIIFNVIIFSVSTVFADTETITVSGGEKGLDEANIAEYVYKGFLDCYKTASMHPIGFLGTSEQRGARSAATSGDPKNIDKLQTNKYYVDSNGDVFSVMQSTGNSRFIYYIDYKATTDVGRIMESDNIFSDQTLINVDRRLENIVGKDKKDGKIWCNESNKTTKANITSEFKRIFGVDNSSLICDGDKFGLFRPKKDEGKKCQEVLTNNNIKLIKNTVDGQKYIDKLYNNWKKTSAYAKNLDEVNDSNKESERDGARDYAYELENFKANCTNQQESLDKITGKTFDFTIKELDSSGNVVEKYPQMGNDRWDKSGKTRYSSYYPKNSKTPLNCLELAKRINEDFDAYRKTIANAKTDACNTEEVIEKANSIVKEYGAKIDAKIPLTDEEKEEYRILSDALLNKDFTVNDGQGGKKCLETNKLKIVVDDTSVDDTTSTSEDAKQSYCQENGGFLSWMLCPAIADGASTTSGLLGYITGLTTVHDSIIKQFDDQGSSIYKAWSTFRNIANIGFVIMLLVVVFSQVTNVGISNYNIKKILPKLIVTAILVNFSYLILGVLIDLSHIVGNGVGSLIRSVAVDSMDADASARAADLITKIAGMVTGVAGAAGIGAVLLSGPALILPVVMFIVTALISVFFGFITLTIRQAAIIMVIVLAPLMMVLYALPNTSAITKKYLSIVKSLLMLYPMFIFATSAGALASSIIVGTSDDPLMMIVGGLLNVLPYFAIPSMTSKSLAGLGAITGAFDKIRGGALKGAGMAGGAIGASEFYKNMKSDFNSDKNLNRSLSRLRKYKAIEDAGGTLSTAQRRRQTEAAGAVLKDAKMRAGGSAAAGIALSNYEGAGFAGLQAAALNELEEAEDKNNMMLFANEGYTPDDMIGMLKEASAADYSKMTDAEKSANDSRIRALTKSLMSTKAGQKAFESQIASNGDMRLSNRAFGQIAHAALKTPGLADKYQVMNNQFSSYVDGGGDTSDTKVQAGLMGSTFSNGISKTLADMNSDKLQKITKFEVGEMYKSGADTTNLDNAFNMLAAASIKDPNLIADFDGIKQEKILEAQGKYIDESQKSTINLRSGGSATIYNPPADFGKYTQTKDASGQIFYTNDRGDIFNASTGKQIKGM